MFETSSHPERLFISWVRYTSRSESLARALGARNAFVTAGVSLGPLKYVPRALHTLSLLLRHRPSVVFVMNLPLFAPLVVWCYCALFRARFVLDVHSGAYNKRLWRKFLWLHTFLARRAAACLTTNAGIGDALAAAGARVLTAPDVPFQLPRGSFEVAEGFSVCMVSLYDVDEPVAELFEVARRMPDATFYVTGDVRKAPGELVAEKPDNVVLTGFIPKEDYGELLQSVSAVAALTTRDNTMQRGGSEAISARKPLITSDWPILRQIFHRGARHCDNTADGIWEAIADIRANYDHYVAEMRALHDERNARWRETLRSIEAAIARQGNGGPPHG